MKNEKCPDCGRMSYAIEDDSCEHCDAFTAPMKECEHGITLMGGCDECGREQASLEGSVAPKCSAWWCDNCQTEIEPECVTYEETHDTRSGGCGHPVGVKQNSPHTDA